MKHEAIIGEHIFSVWFEESQITTQASSIKLGIRSSSELTLGLISKKADTVKFIALKYHLFWERLSSFRRGCS